MKNKTVQLLCAAGILTSSIAFANTGTIGITGVNGATDSAGVYIGPYSGPFSGTAATIYCDDLNHVIYIGATPTNVNISNISNLSLTRFGGPLAATAAVAKSDYEQIFYLSTFLTNPTLNESLYPTFVGGTNSANTNVHADVQDAMWSYFAPNAENIGTNQVNYWVTQAGANAQNYNYASIDILTDSANQYNGVQELFVNTNPGGNILTPTPEPSLWFVLAAGMGVLGIFVQRRTRQAGQLL